MYPEACISPITTYFGILMEIIVKQAKVDGCKPSLQARLSKHYKFAFWLHWGKVQEVEPTLLTVYPVDPSITAFTFQNN